MTNATFTSNEIEPINTNAMPKLSATLIVIMTIISLGFGGWAGSQAFADTMAPFAAIAMMGMMGYVFHAVILGIMFVVEAKVRQYLAIALLLWHIPEALLIAFFTMGVPDGKLTGVIIHSAFVLASLVIYYQARNKS